MSKYEDGFCDDCGCELTDVFLTSDGRELCVECVTASRIAIGRIATKPGARDDGR